MPAQAAQSELAPRRAMSYEVIIVQIDSRVHVIIESHLRLCVLCLSNELLQVHIDPVWFNRTPERIADSHSKMSMCPAVMVSKPDSHQREIASSMISQARQG